jgi:integrase
MNTLNELFDEFLNCIRGQSAASQRNYRTRLSEFLERHGDLAPAQLGRRHVNDWHNKLLARDLAEATLAGYRQALRAFCNWLVEERHMERSPAAHLRIGSYLPARSRLPAEADVEAITNMVNAWIDARRTARQTLATCAGPVALSVQRLAYPAPSDVRDAAIWLVARGCGPRSGELCNWRLSSLQRALERGPDAFGIFSAESKGKTGKTIIRFDERTAAALRDWLEARPPAECGYVFVTTQRYHTGDGFYRPLTRSALTRVFERLARHAGAASPVRSHALRHRVGDLVTRQHGPKVAALLLNHRDAQTAATAIAFYHHPDEKDINRAVANLGI